MATNGGGKFMGETSGDQATLYLKVSDSEPAITVHSIKLRLSRSFKY